MRKGNLTSTRALVDDILNEVRITRHMYYNISCYHPGIWKQIPILAQRFDAILVW